MDGGTRNREGHDGEQRGTPRFHEDMFRKRAREVPDHKGGGQRHGEG